MKKTIKAITLFLVMMTSASAWATDFIKDVMVIGGSEKETDNLKSSLRNQGWTVITRDLNAGASGDYILLLYKSGSNTDGINHSYITDFYIDNEYKHCITYKGRTYYPVPIDGGTNFKKSNGDLNRGSAGDYIYLYYTKNQFADKRAITEITINDTQSGAVGLRGGTKGYDLNSKAGGKYIYMHPATATTKRSGTVTFGQVTKDLAHWSITPKSPIVEDATVTIDYTGNKYVKSFRAVKQWSQDLAMLTDNMTVTDGMTLTGKLGKNVKMSIADGATVMLKDMAINGVDWEICPWAGITCEGDATIVLSGKNYVRGFHRGYPGIFVPEGKTLTIRGEGSLEALASESAAGIGGGYDINCGNIIIEGGRIIAHGGWKAAAIGGGYNSSCGDIIISIDTDTITVHKGTDATYSIGPGENGTCGTLLIGDDENPVTDKHLHLTGNAITTNEMPEGLRSAHNEPIFPVNNKNTWTFPMPDCNAKVIIDYQAVGDVTFADNTEDVQNWNISPSNPVNYDADVTLTYTGNKIVKEVTAVKEWYGDLSNLTGNVTVTNRMTLTGNLKANVKVSIADGATVLLKGISIEGVNSDDYRWAGITCEGDATIYLSDSSFVKGFYQDYPAIYVPVGKTLTIRGNGKLVAQSGGISAGIGAGNGISCGNIVIKGGTVEADGGTQSAGIGGALNANCGDITITDEVISISAGKQSGAPYSIGPGNNGTCGTITISSTKRDPINNKRYIYIGKHTSKDDVPTGLSIDAFAYTPIELTGTWGFKMPATDGVKVSVEYLEICDVNDDGNVDVADIAAIIDVMAGNGLEYKERADVNGDGSVDVADIATIIDRMAEK